MSNLDRYLKGFILLVWGAACALRWLDIKGTFAEGARFVPTSTASGVSPVWADSLALLMSLGIILAALLLIGRVQKAWMILSAAIVFTKVVTVAADFSVGDLPAGDLLFTSAVTFVFPAVALLLLIRSRRLLEAESVQRAELLPR